MNPELIERRFQRERQARKAAEKLLEEKSLELYTVNKKLAESAQELEKRIVERTKQLHSSEYRKSAILNSAFDAIFTFDIKGNILEFNPAAQKLFGYKTEEVMGKPMAEYLLPLSANSSLSKSIESLILTIER